MTPLCRNTQEQPERVAGIQEALLGRGGLEPPRYSGLNACYREVIAKRFSALARPEAGARRASLLLEAENLAPRLPLAPPDCQQSRSERLRRCGRS
jgi:hypothetical protein